MTLPSNAKKELKKLHQIQKDLASDNASMSAIDFTKIFDRYGDLQKKLLFTCYFQTIPQVISQENIDNEEAYRFVIQHYRNDLKNHIFEISINQDDGIDNEERYCFLYEDLIIRFAYGDRIDYLFRQTDIAKVEEIIERLTAFSCKEEDDDEPQIHLLVRSGQSIDIKSLPLTAPKLDIASNYNDDFFPIHEVILQRLNQQNDKGLVLLHGKPGTGKTSYIRFLATSLKKKIIFLPPDMASAITSPDLIPLLMDHRNSILVIEDAEKIIMDKDSSGYSPVSTLLNLADGLLSDCLNIQIICAFNTDLAKVDKALLRKGRLIAKYEFQELEIKKAQELSDRLGFNTMITEPLALTGVYNQEEQEFKLFSGTAPMGFSLETTSYKTSDLPTELR